MRFLIVLFAALALAGCLEGYEDLTIGPSPNDDRGNFTMPGLNQSENATGNVSTNNSNTTGGNATGNASTNQTTIGNSQGP